MQVEVETENKDYEIYETEKFRFKIEKISLENLREKENFPQRILTKIQKNMRTKVKRVNGQEWEESFKAIYKEIVGEELD